MTGLMLQRGGKKKRALRARFFFPPYTTESPVISMDPLPDFYRDGGD
nr:hypothetical protein [Bacteroidota bacterium]